MSHHLVITVHGIRTYGQWQERLEALVPQEERNSITFVHYKIGLFTLPMFLFPLARWLATRRFRKCLLGHLSNEQWNRIDLVGHSFGTHLIAWALRHLSHPHGDKVHTVIFAGSVLRNNFDWSQVLGRNVKRVINDCSVNDYILILSQLFSLFTGSAGREGFVGATGGATGSELRNRFFRVGHSGYFTEANNTDASQFMKDRWLPLLLEKRAVVLVDCRVANPITLFFTWLSNNADPIKLVVYLTPTILFVLWINGLYEQKEAARFSALKNESRTSALVSEQMIETGNFQDAIRLGLGALPENISHPDRPYVPAAESALYSAILSYRHNLARNFPINNIVLEAFISLGTNRVVVLTSRNNEIVPTDGGLLRVLDIETNEILFEKDVSEFPSDFASADNGNLFAFVDRSGTRESVVVHHALHGITNRYPLDDQFWRIDDIAFTSDATHVLTISLPMDRRAESVLHSWSIDTKETPSTPETLPLQGASRGGGADFSFSPGAQYVWSSEVGRARLWRVSTGKLVATVTPGENNISSNCSGTQNRSYLSRYVDLLAFDRDGRYVVFESVPGVGVVWDIESDSQVALLLGHTGSVVDAVFNRDGTLVFTASADRTARIWDVSNGSDTREEIPSNRDDSCAPKARLIGTLVGHNDVVTRVAVTSKDTAITTSLDGSLREWKIETGLQVYRLDGFSGGENAEHIAFSSDGREVLVVSRAFTGLQGQTVRLWKLDAGEKIASFLASGPRRNRVILDPNGRRALSMLRRRPDTPLLWEVDTATELGWLTGHQQEVFAATFSSDGRHVATGSADGSVKVWEVESGKEVVESRSHEDAVIFVAFSFDDRFIVTASRDETIRIWDPWTSALIEEVPYLYQTTNKQDYTQRVMDMLSLNPISVRPGTL